MNTLTRNASDLYIQKVMSLIHAPEAERARIEEDLRAHLQEGMAEGEDMTALVERMGEPREVAAEFMAELPQVYAGFWPRLAAFLIDFGVLVLIGGVGWALFALFGSQEMVNESTRWGVIWSGTAIILAVISANAAIAMIIAYFPLFEARFGQTLGKRILNLRVCMENGLPVGTWPAILRRLSFFFQIFPIDALFVFFNPKKQRGFDILARTVVVKE